MANINEVLFSLLHGVFQSVTAFVVIAFAFEYCRNVLEIEFLLKNLVILKMDMIVVHVKT